MDRFVGMNYVYGELLTVQSTEDPAEKEIIGTQQVGLYLELDPNKAAAERKCISLAQASQLRDDLTRILTEAYCE